MTNNKTDQEVVKRLNVMIALLLDKQEDSKNEKQKIEKLYSFGLDYKDIAQILGKNPVNVAVVLNALKKEK